MMWYNNRENDKKEAKELSINEWQQWYEKDDGIKVTTANMSRKVYKVQDQVS